MLFGFLITFVILQRLIELMIARRNEDRMKREGAIEFGSGHYPWMVLMHIGFFLSLFLEVLVLKKNVSPFWPFLVSLFLVAQAGRIWALASLGKYWNTKIIVLPGAEPVRKGPYRFLKHPNYVIVTLELLVIPLLFNAYITAAVFAILNAIMLSIRIPAEESALKKLTEYENQLNRNGKIESKMLKKFDN
ncbi:isoprenylcysteine carboxyl methyltransferase family protein [Bacillus sp. B-jedd]|uniref:isoprenylcysteine carboxyl methyltransferase family protein n=1 Tax=Bacillus sp. B-jedd TaxID=1476857 RepID=UPI000662A1F2|nr:isoprenylcysteine carboxylmethyltransferase family protein [Bacillus sp. B-jedd]